MAALHMHTFCPLIWAGLDMIIYGVATKVCPSMRVDWMHASFVHAFAHPSVSLIRLAKS